MFVLSQWSYLRTVGLRVQEMERELMDLEAKGDAARALSWACSSSKPWSETYLTSYYRQYIPYLGTCYTRKPLLLFRPGSPNLFSKQPCQSAQEQSLQSLAHSSRPQATRMQCLVLCWNAMFKQFKLQIVFNLFILGVPLWWWFQMAVMVPNHR